MFNNVISRTMVVLVGKIKIDSTEHTTSMFPGSPSASVCPLKHPGYFVGIYSSGCRGHNMNVATSVDNVEFVQQYMDYVLPQLPSPVYITWVGKEISQFYHLLGLSYIPCNSSCLRKFYILYLSDFFVLISKLNSAYECKVKKLIIASFISGNNN